MKAVRSLASTAGGTGLRRKTVSPWLNSRGLTEETFVFHASGCDRVHYVVQQVLHLFMALKNVLDICVQGKHDHRTVIWLL